MVLPVLLAAPAGGHLVELLAVCGGGGWLFWRRATTPEADPAPLGPLERLQQLRAERQEAADQKAQIDQVRRECDGALNDLLGELEEKDQSLEALRDVAQQQARELVDARAANARLEGRVVKQQRHQQYLEATLERYEDRHGLLSELSRQPSADTTPEPSRLADDELFPSRSDSTLPLLTPPNRAHSPPFSELSSVSVSGFCQDALALRRPSPGWSRSPSLSSDEAELRPSPFQRGLAGNEPEYILPAKQPLRLGAGAPRYTAGPAIGAALQRAQARRDCPVQQLRAQCARDAAAPKPASSHASREALREQAPASKWTPGTQRAEARPGPGGRRTDSRPRARPRGGTPFGR